MEEGVTVRKARHQISGKYTIVIQKQQQQK